MQNTEKPEENNNPLSGKNENREKPDFNRLFQSFIDEYNKNNQKQYDAGKVSAWLDLAEKYAKLKPGDKHGRNPAESMDSSNMNDILEKTKKNDESTISEWLAFAEKHKNDLNN